MNSVASDSVGLVGTGLIGSALAERLMAAGFSLLVTDVDRAKVQALLDQSVSSGKSASSGISAATDAAEVLARCRRVILSLPDDSVVRTVLKAAPPAPGTLLVDTSTGDPAGARALAASLKESGVRYVDATISGSSEQVRRGEVLVMAGGAEEDAAQCADIFAAFARSVMHTGAAGTGAAMKLVTNLVLGLNRAALAEGLVFAETQGISRAQALEVLLASAAYSKIMDTKGPKMVGGDFTPVARLSQHLKDVRLMLDAAGQTPLPLSAAHRLILETAEAAGLGALDNSALVRAWETLRKGDA
jgi:3-hydroxyisobutyrate dehydrogenase-like beta-hydroxyacid dehydrogenase